MPSQKSVRPIDYLSKKVFPHRHREIFFRTLWEVSYTVGSIICRGKYHIPREVSYTAGSIIYRGKYHTPWEVSYTVGSIFVIGWPGNIRDFYWKHLESKSVLTLVTLYTNRHICTVSEEVMFSLSLNFAHITRGLHLSRHTERLALEDLLIYHHSTPYTVYMDYPTIHMIPREAGHRKQKPGID